MTVPIVGSVLHMASRNCKGRSLHWSICQSEQVADVPDPWAKLMFTWMIANVDNCGRMEGEPYQVAGLIFPLEMSKGTVTTAKVEKYLQALHDQALIVWYKSGRLRYVWLPKFGNRQTLTGNMKAVSDYPAPSEADIQAWREREQTVSTSSIQGTDAVGTEAKDKAKDKASYVDGCEAVFTHWREVMGKNGATVLDDKRKRAVTWALEHYDIDTCLAAIDGYATSDFHMGRDPKSDGKKFNDLTLIFRDADHVEKFLGKPKTGCELVDEVWGGDED